MSETQRVKPGEDATPPELPAIAERILVPVANPATAENLLRLALSLLETDGRVIAAFVMPHSVEPHPQPLQELQAIVETLQAEGAPVTLVTDAATSIPRGILDMAQEQNADLILVGVRGQQHGQVVLGPVAEAVARTAPCNVLIYRGTRPLHQGKGYRQVVVPADGSRHSRLAARIGLRFARRIGVPLTMVYVQTEARMRRWQALGLIEASLEDLPELEHGVEIRRQVIRAADVVSGIVERSSPDTLVLLGFSEQSSLDNWLFGDIPQRMLARAPGPLILVKQIVGERVTQKVGHRLANLMPTLTPAEELEVRQAALDMARPTVDFVVLVVLSCLIASLGLVQNSPAVIIGAMLVAPLMSPLMGFAVGMVEGDTQLMRRAALTMLRGVLLALLLAIVVGLLTPLKKPTAEMLARGEPSLPDLGVALFAGMAGAYAMARKDIPSALAGVAIAAALMPPLCTVGIALAFARPALASGAFFLFITNIAAISLGGAAVFLWLGLRLRRSADDAASYRRRFVAAAIVLLLLAVPLGDSLRQSALAASHLESAWTVLRDQLSGARVMDVQWVDGSHTAIVATVQGPEPPTPDQVAKLQALLAEQIGREVALEVIAWQQVRPAGP
ncbi:MAG: TIGR00341 family protein [Anaerolineae bacterium]|nr:TIGR00341 family protein [Anaerolineae bacterium]